MRTIGRYKCKRKVVSTLLLITVSLSVIKSQEINHGVILGGSLGFISNLQYDHSDNINGGSATFSRRGGLFIGYKLRMIYRQKPLFYDVDLVAGGRAMEYSRYLISSLLVGNSILPSGQIALYSLSATPSINYRFWKGLLLDSVYLLLFIIDVQKMTDGFLIPLLLQD